MKINPLKRNHLLFPKLASFAVSAIATIALALPGTLQAAAITWGGATISADTDTLTNGTALYAYDWANTAATLNGVNFTGSSSASGAGANVTITSSAGSIGNTTSAYTSGSTPFSALSTAYKSILVGGDYASSSSSTFTITLENLTVGETYAVQIWVNDPRGGSYETRSETVTSSGGNTIALAYEFDEAAGGVGQYGIGTFTATATTQAFTLLGAGSTQLNALQVRDVTGTGYTPPGPPPALPVSGGTWNGASTSDSDWSDAANWGGVQFATNQDLASGITFSGTTRQINTNDLPGLTLGSITFSTANWNITGNPVALSGSISDNIAGSSTWGLATTLNSTPSIGQSGSSDIINFTGVLSGSGGISKPAGSTGQGQVYLSNTNNSFTGGVSLSSGTVDFYSLAPAGTNSSLGAGSGAFAIGSSSTSYGATFNFLGTNSGTTDRALTFAGSSAAVVETLANNSPNNSGLTFNGAVNFTVPVTLSFSGTSSGTNTFTGVFNNGNVINCAMQISGPGTWAFDNVIGFTNSLTIATNSNMVLGYDSTYGNSTILFPTINVKPGGTFDVSSYDQNGSIFVLANYGGFTQTLTAGRTNGASITDVNGSLNLSGSGGAVLNVAGTGMAGTLTISSNLVTASGTLDFDLNTSTTVGSAVNDLINVGNNVDLSQGTATVVIKPLAGVITTNVWYTLFVYSGSLIGNAAGLNVLSPGRAYTAGVVDTSIPGLVRVLFNPSGATAANLVWSGNFNANWDVDTTENWLNNGLSDYFYEGDNVTFNDNSSQASVNVASSLGAGSITVSNNVNSYSFSATTGGSINSGLLTKEGTGQLAISTANTYSSGTVISAGTVIANNSSALGSGTVTLGDTNTGSNMVTLELGSSGIALANAITISSNGTAPVVIDGNGGSFNGPVTLQRDLVISNSTAFNDGVSGTNNLIIISGNQNLQNVATTMSGTIFITNTATLDIRTLMSNAPSINVASGAGLQMNQTPVIGSLSGGGTVSPQAALTYDVWMTIGSSNASGLFSGNFTNTTGGIYVGIYKTGTGTETFTGNNGGSFGFTVVSNGWLVIDNTNGSGLGLGSVSVISGATLAGNGSIYSTNNSVSISGVLAVGNAGDTSGAAFTLTNTGGLTINSGGTLKVNLFSGAGAGDNTAKTNAADVLMAECPVKLNSGAVLTVGYTNGLTGWAVGDKWKIANWNSTPTGTFTALNLPTLPSNLAWSTSSLYSSGIISIVVSAPTQPASITSVTTSGGNLIISGTNYNGGQNFHYEVLTTTNLLTPLTNWTVLSTNSFNANGTFNYTNAMNSTNPAVFFDVKAVQ